MVLQSFLFRLSRTDLALAKKQLFYFFSVGFSRWKKNKCAVCALAFLVQMLMFSTISALCTTCYMIIFIAVIRLLAQYKSDVLLLLLRKDRLFREVSKGLFISLRLFWVTWVYIIVVSGLLWPNNSWIYRISVPCSSK